MHISARRLAWLAVALFAGGLSSESLMSHAAAEESQPLTFTLRDRPLVEPDGAAEPSDSHHAAPAVEPGEHTLRYRTVEWDPAKTAVIVCDMWDKLWCPVTTARVAELAPAMNDVLKELRDRGVLVIHAPSGTLEPYEGTPQRKRCQQAPPVETDPPLQGWCHLDPKREPPLPLDDEYGWQTPEPEGGIERVQSRQHPAIEIAAADAIGCGKDVFYLLQQRGIENVILMGVHTNKCVLGRPFGIRQLTYQGKNVVLMRDMTDSLYSPEFPPHVSHVRGTEMVVEHIEKHWCPTITSTEVLHRPAFRFSEDKRPHVAILVSDDHYHADKTLPRYAQRLRENHGCYCTVHHGQGTAVFPNLAELRAADVLVLYIRRLAPPKEQLAAIKEYLREGNPLVALRTASHAFAAHYSIPGKNVPPGHAEWREFDPEVLGGSYHGHAGNELGTDVAVVPGRADHPLLSGVKPAKWHSAGSMYYTSPLADDATMLMLGSADDETEPLTWYRSYRGGRVFYTGLGHPADFEEPPFRRLLLNAIFWAMDRPVPKP